jgi:uncharacterized protein YecT (DUF1311 family)
MRFFLFVVILLATTLAAPGGASATDCANATSQSAMDECADISYKKADATLNADYRTILGKLKSDPAKTKLLASAETAWIVFRDAECKFSASATAGASIYPMMVTGCLERLTLARVKDLKTYLSCSEYDMSCPVKKS